MLRIVRNETVARLYDVVDVVYNHKTQQTTITPVKQGLQFEQAQVMLGVDPTETVRDAEGDIV